MVAIRVPPPYRAAALALAERIARAVFTGGNVSRAALDEWQEVVAKMRAWGALTGARSIGSGDNGRDHAAQFAAADPTTASSPRQVTVGAFFDQPFEAALRAFLERYPDIQLSPRGLARVYLEKGKTLAEEAAGEMWRGINASLATAMRENIPVRSWRDLMQATRKKTVNYWETVYHTNVRRAYTDGQIAQVQTVRGIIGMGVVVTRDNVTRPNHRAYDGWVCPKDSPQLERHSSPYGFRCRCRMVPVTRASAERRGLEIAPSGNLVFVPPPPGAHPDEGFK